ncbi:unnamed protein product, partial [Prorocentrum cordatum]
AAKLLYNSIPNNAKLASCLVQLGEYTQAVEAARKANNPKVWKEVNIACVSAEQFRCAEIAAMNIIVHPDHLEELIAHYEQHGYFEELISLLDAGLSQERAHAGMYTELGILFAKYKPDKLMDFIKMNTAKLNIPKLTNACERHYLWEEAVFLHSHYDEYDLAASTMMAHSPVAYSHDKFLMIMQKVSNMELYYRAISFRLDAGTADGDDRDCYGREHARRKAQDLRMWKLQRKKVRGWRPGLSSATAGGPDRSARSAFARSGAPPFKSALQRAPGTSFRSARLRYAKS